ncbi:MAG: hypothetical protein P8X64_15030 [Anaerolineales bacterium]
MLHFECSECGGSIWLRSSSNLFQKLDGVRTPGPSPTPTTTPTPVTGWEYACYSYEPAHSQAVATIVREPEGFTYPVENMQGERRCQREHDHPRGAGLVAGKP